VAGKPMSDENSERNELESHRKYHWIRKTCLHVLR